jgi:hypothetical protein
MKKLLLILGAAGLLVYLFSEYQSEINKADKIIKTMVGRNFTHSIDVSRENLHRYTLLHPTLPPPPAFERSSKSEQAKSAPRSKESAQVERDEQTIAQTASYEVEEEVLEEVTEPVVASEDKPAPTSKRNKWVEAGSMNYKQELVRSKMESCTNCDGKSTKDAKVVGVVVNLDGKRASAFNSHVKRGHFTKGTPFLYVE